MHPSFKLKGEAGGVVILGTDEITGEFEVIVPMLEGTVIESYTCSTLGGDSLAEITLPLGVPIFGHFTKLKLSGGGVIAYNHPRV